MGIANPNPCVTLANGQVRAAYALRDDLLAVLFPLGGVLPSELLQSRVRFKLNALASGVEAALLDKNIGGNISWPILSESGLLREQSLIDFALARISEDTLSANLHAAENVKPLAQLPVTLMAHDNDRIAEMARALLHSSQANEGQNAMLHKRLDGELLHQLTWRVAAALIEANAATSDSISAAVHALLRQHGGTDDPLAISRKLIFFLGFEHHGAIHDPRTAGLHLFIASLGRYYDLADDLVLRIIGADHPAPLLLLLKGKDTSPGAAHAITLALKGKPALADLANLENDYAVMDAIEARAVVASWREDSLA